MATNIEAVKRNLLRAFVTAINKQKKSSFNAFAANIWVRAATEPDLKWLPEIKMEDGSISIYVTFIVRVDSGRMALTIPARFHYGNARIKWQRKWMSFDEFGGDVVRGPQSYGPLGDEGYETLWRWYEFRAEPFRFMDLPKELRQETYKFVVGDDVYPRIVRPGLGVIGVSLGGGWAPTAPLDSLKGTHSPGDEVPPPKADILNVNKQVRDEAAAVVWLSSRQCFATATLLVGPPVLRQHLPTNALSRVELNFDTFQYFYFFGVQVPPWTLQQLVTGPAEARVLQRSSLPNLTELTIKFRSTRWEPLTNPWTIQMGQAGWTRLFATRFACQKIVSEMVLTFAFEYIKHIKTVNLEGCVKTSTKAAFKAAIEELKQDPAKSFPTDSWGMKKVDVHGWDMANLPPQCNCTNKCGFWGVKVLMDPNRPARRGGKVAESPEKVFAKYKWDCKD